MKYKNTPQQNSEISGVFGLTLNIYRHSGIRTKTLKKICRFSFKGNFYRVSFADVFLIFFKLETIWIKTHLKRLSNKKSIISYINPTYYGWKSYMCTFALCYDVDLISFFIWGLYSTISESKQ